MTTDTRIASIAWSTTAMFWLEWYKPIHVFLDKSHEASQDNASNILKKSSRKLLMAA